MTQRERIVEQAANMFAEQGIKSIRMDDIAKALGVSKRTLYELFEDKEELLYHSIRFMQRRRMTTIEAKMKESRDTLAYLFESVSMMMDNKDLHRRISSNLRKFYPATFERVRKEAEEDSGKILYSLIEHYIDCGLIVPTVDIRLSVTILYYTATTLVTTADNMSLPAGVSLEDALTYTIINFFRGIATIEGVRQIDEYFCRKKQQRENDNNI
ncbi:MAG: TetR/AcrR family transcriptional regulator [Alistipes sp.]|nr:TetR/AcrR family transcriptional regulator [Alistipes sp.]